LLNIAGDLKLHSGFTSQLRTETWPSNGRLDLDLGKG